MFNNPWYMEKLVTILFIMALLSTYVFIMLAMILAIIQSILDTKKESTEAIGLIQQQLDKFGEVEIKQSMNKLVRHKSKVSIESPIVCRITSLKER